MKKFYLALFVLMFCVLPSAAKEKSEMIFSPDAKQINIIYIHGANETRDHFNKSVRNVHDDMIKEFESDSLMYSKLLKNGQKKIGEEEIVFFWADRTKENLKILDNALSRAKNCGTKLVQFGRETLSRTLHDAIWVSKPNNSRDILNNLNDIVKAEHSKGNEVILYGYSAGSLIASQYMQRKLRTIKLNDIKPDSVGLKKSYLGKFFKECVKNQKLESTCLDALTESKILFYTDGGQFVTNPDISYLKNAFPKLNEYTATYCAPEDTVDGVVVFGTPLTTFDSEISINGTYENMLSQLMLKYIVEKDLFFLTVNYANDFIAMPLPGKPSVSFLNSSPILADTQYNGGFIYDDSAIKNCSNIASAHLSYWYNGKKFARNIVKVYNEGYEYFYNTKSE